jgi:hypothetical protein
VAGALRIAGARGRRVAIGEFDVIDEPPWEIVSKLIGREFKLDLYFFTRPIARVWNFCGGIEKICGVIPKTKQEAWIACFNIHNPNTSSIHNRIHLPLVGKGKSEGRLSA